MNQQLQQLYSLGEIKEIMRLGMVSQNLSLPENSDCGNTLCMKGTIRTKEVCPRCNKKFTFQDEKDGYFCLDCLTVPKKFYIDLHSTGSGRIRIFSDKSGNSFNSYKHVRRTLEHIRYEIDQKTFDANDYKPREAKEYRFENRVAEWLKIKENYVEKNNLAQSYVKKLKQYEKSYFREFFKGKDVRDVKTGDIEKFYRSLPNHLSLKTQKNVMDALFNFFKLLKEHDYIERMPKFPKVEVPEFPYAWIDSSMQDDIFNHIPKKHSPIFYFMRRTGVRPGEARALQKQDINFKEKIIVVRRTFSDEKLREFTKSKRIRVLPLADDVIDVLKKLPIPMHPDSFVFTHEGRPYSQWTLFYWWKKAKKNAGINPKENLRLYDGTRHSFASQAVNRGVPLNLISTALGHTNEKMTKRYAHLLTDSLKTVFEKPSPKNRHQTVTKAKIVNFSVNKFK